jgi:hypothetical protein
MVQVNLFASQISVFIVFFIEENLILMETVQLYAIPRYFYISGQRSVKAIFAWVLGTLFESQNQYCLL